MLSKKDGFGVGKKKAFKTKKIPTCGDYIFLCSMKYKPKFVWVRGHAGNIENERCDQLAVAAAERPNLPPDEEYEKGGL
jgi:ribonuclease HI